MEGPHAGPIVECLSPVEGRESEFEAAIGYMPSDILGRIVVTNVSDMMVVRDLIKATGCDCCSVAMMNPKSAHKKYKISDAPEKSRTEMLVRDFNVESIIAFNFIADEFAKVDFSDGEES